jgi:peptidyl-prolyl cis-trans isomerase D
MLEFFRQHVGGFLGAIVIGILVVAFALSFGAQSAGWGKGQVIHVKATVDGDDIPETTVRYALNLMGARGAEEDAQRYAMQKQALDGLVERQLLVSLAESMGISADMDEALDEIAADRIYLTRPVGELHDRLSRSFFVSADNMTAALVEDGHRVGHSFSDPVKGQFDIDAYKKFVRNYLQVTEEAFEEQQRLELIARRMRQILASSVRVSTGEVRAQYERDNDTVVLEYLSFAPDQISDKLPLSPEEISAYAANHQDEINQYYETNKFRYTGLEKQVRARHILIKPTSTEDEAAKKDAKARAEELKSRVEAGEDFAALAKSHSDDEASAEQGGDLGFNPKGRMVAAFDEAMFSLPAGALSEIVETEYGFHIIKVEEIREGDVPMETAHAEIAEKLMREASARQKAQDAANSALNRITNGESLEDVIRALNAEDPALADLQVLVTAPISRADQATGGGRPELADVAKAAFETDTDPEALNKVLEIRGRYFVSKVKERNKPSDEDFLKQRNELTRSLLAVKQASFLKERLTEILASAKKDGRINYHGQADAPVSPTAPAQNPTPLPPTQIPADEAAPVDVAPTADRAAPVDVAPTADKAAPVDVAPAADKAAPADVAPAADDNDDDENGEE